MGSRCRLALVSVLLGLASVGTASAEGGWLFWQDWDGSWMTTGTFETLGECKARVRDEVALQRLRSTAIVTEDSVVFQANGKNYSRRYHCLPDTVDPRGPKGK